MQRMSVHPVSLKRSALSRASVGLILLIVLSFFLFVLPVIMVVLGAFRDSAPGAVGNWTLEPIAEVLATPRTYQALTNSLILMVACIGLGVGMAIGLAWLAARSDSFLRRLLTPGMIVLFAVPQLFYALSWTMLGRAPSGTVNSLFRLVTGSDASPIDLVSWTGLILVLSLKIASISYLVLLGPFSAIDSSIEEAARTSGSSRLGAFFRVELPVLAPAVLSAVVLAGVIAVGSLDIPLIFGRSAGIPLLSTEVYDYVNGKIPADYASANTIALFIVAIVAILISGQRSLLAGRTFTTLSGKSHRRERVHLGRFRWVGGVAIGAFLLVGAVLPVGQLVLGSLQPYAGVWAALTLDNYVRVLDSPRIVNAFFATFWVGLSAGLIASSLAVLIAIVAQRSRSRFARVPQAMVFALLAVPGLTIGLGLLAVVLGVPGLQIFYGTIWLNVAGLAIAMTPIANRLTSGAVAQVGKEMEEAARISGASLPRAVTEILVRLILPSFFASWFVTAIVAAGNLEIPALLSSPGTETIAVAALGLFSLGSLSQASAVFCIFLFAITVASTIVFALNALLSRLRRIAAERPVPPAEPPVESARAHSEIHPVDPDEPESLAYLKEKDLV